ncbi:MAG TPA: type II toxin-antitoxin system VapC family toxin [Candidatus Bathyarchaeia archaeon]|nr:type II toxin-antitoxin system VapC family toxin [Candidatus Bathyarchaeia archaeon]
MIVIDTDVLIEILDKKSEKGDEALNQILQSEEEICTTVINIHEILCGLHKYGKPVKEILLLPVLSYMKKDAVSSSKIELEAEERGNSIRRTDAMIAAMAINNGAALYTFDFKHFSPLKALGLKLFP